MNNSQPKRYMDIKATFDEWKNELCTCGGITASLAIFLMLGFDENLRLGVVISLAIGSGLFTYFLIRSLATWATRPNIQHLLIRNKIEEHFYIEKARTDEETIEDLEETAEIEFQETRERIVSERYHEGPAATILAYAEADHLESTDWRGIYEYLVATDEPAFSRRSLRRYVNHFFYTRREGKNYQTFPHLMRQIGAASLVGNDYKWIMPQARSIMRGVANELSPPPPPPTSMVQNPSVPAGTGVVQGRVPVETAVNGVGEAEEGELTVWDIFPADDDRVMQ